MMRTLSRTHRLHWLLIVVLALGGATAAAAAEDERHGVTSGRLIAQADTGAAPEEAPVDEHAQAEGEHEQPPLLNVDPGMYFWTVVLFLLLFGVLAKWVWPQILTGLQQREDKIRTDLEQAEQARKDADQTLQQYKAQLAEARKEAQQIVEQSRGEAQKVADQLKAQTQTEIQQMRDRAQREIQSAREEAVADVYERTAELATHIAGRILQREISSSDQKALVESTLNELAQAEQGSAAQSV